MRTFFLDKSSNNIKFKSPIPKTSNVQHFALYTKKMNFLGIKMLFYVKIGMGTQCVIVDLGTNRTLKC